MDLLDDRGHQSYLGDYPRQVAFGATATVVLFFAGVFFVGASQGIGPTGIKAVALAGFLTGLSLGREWFEGAVVAFRAVVIGLAVSAVAVSVVLFVLWRARTGQNFLYWSPLFGVFLLLLSPLFGFAGAVGGGIGTVVRRFVVPPKYDPPTH